MSGFVTGTLAVSSDLVKAGMSCCEMRDSEMMAAALTAAETGHLVLSSLHTNDAAQTVLRILDIFPSNYQSQIRQQLSLALLAIISQQLMPASTGTGRYPAVEIMLATNAIRNLIRRGDDHQLRAHIETARSEGMLTMEQSLAELIRSGRVTREAAFDHSHHSEDLCAISLDETCPFRAQGVTAKWKVPWLPLKNAVPPERIHSVMRPYLSEHKLEIL